MTWQELKDIWEAKQVELGLVLVGITLIGAGVFLWRSDYGETKVEIIKAGSEKGSEEEARILVDVSGEVMNPGVVELQNEARVKDAIAGAGGFTQEADREWVDKYLNLAAKVTDGQKLFIPEKKDGEMVLGQETGVNEERININTASAVVLDELPGVGEVTAGKIISGRPYSKVEELLERKIVGQKVYEQIEGKISVY